MDDRRKRRHPHIFGVEGQKNMMHGRIEADGDIFDIFPGQTQIGFPFLGNFHVFVGSFFSFFLLLGWKGIFDGLVNEFVDTLDNVIAHALKAVRSGHMIGDPGHDVLTVLALGVHHGYRVDHIHIGKVTEIGRHGGGPHIDGQSVSVFLFTRSNPDDFPVIPNTDRHRPFTVTKGPGQLP